jgi:hypothetical protein
MVRHLHLGQQQRRHGLATAFARADKVGSADVPIGDLTA